MVGDELRMRGHHVNAGLDDPGHFIQIGLNFILAEQIHEGMIGLRADALTVHDLQPAHLGEQLVALSEHAAV